MVWAMPTHVDESVSSSLSPLTQMIISSGNTLTDIPREVFSKLSWHPLKSQVETKN
jgi:hypothetical protein